MAKFNFNAIIVFLLILTFGEKDLRF